MNETQFYEYLYQQEQRSKAMNEWQPIDTAPKDWENIILYLPFMSGMIDQEEEVIQGYFSPYDGGVDCWMTSRNQECVPTHWMPLPKPPTE